MLITRRFHIDDLNTNKYNLLYEKAVLLLNYKNEISNIVYNNIGKYMTLDIFTFIKTFRKKIFGCNNQEISMAIQHVYSTYSMIYTKFLKSLEFKIQKSNNNDSKVHSNSTKICTYLAKFWNEHLIEWCSENCMNNAEKSILEFRLQVVKFCEKFGIRVNNLIAERRHRVFLQILKSPVLFKSLNFRGINETKSKILEYKSNTSKYRCVITLSGQHTDSGKLRIPVKYSEDYHGNVESYNNKIDNKGYRKSYYEVHFLENKKIQISLINDDNKESAPKNKTNYYGIDVNIKNNLFCDSVGNIIDYNREMVNNYVTFLKKIDNKISIKIKNNKPKQKSIRDRNKLKLWKIRITDMLERQIRKLINQAKSLGKDHIILENLKDLCGYYGHSEEFQNIKYSRLSKILNISGLKNIIKRIANKHDIQVTFVQSHYTSQTCKCGHISKNNRKTQEIFKCESCGRELNADMNAASNIEDRLALDVLRSSLLSKDKDGNFKPKKLRKEIIKSILCNFYSSQQQVEAANSTKYLNCA